MPTTIIFFFVLIALLMHVFTSWYARKQAEKMSLVDWMKQQGYLNND
jgi:ABC-type antimicrobial peptide transport system permease subunit